MKTLKIALIGVLLMSLGACSNEKDAETPYTEIELPAGTRSALEANNEFSVTLLEKIGNNTAESYAVSPFSIVCNLAMLANGDDGQARAQTLEVLGYADSDIEALNTYCRLMSTMLPTLDSKTTFKISNLVAYNYSESFCSDFETVGKDVFKSGFLKMSGSPVADQKDINGWISDKTDGMIPSFYEDPVGFNFSCINACFFKGEWTEKFDSKNTKKASFHNADGSITQTDFMALSHDLKYSKDSGFEALSLNFGNKNFSMVFVKPTDNSSNYELEPQIVKSLFEKLTLYSVELKVPKFETVTRNGIIDVLKAMGLNAPFDEEIGYKRIFENRSIPLAAIDHMVKLTVDENGAVAAAVTASTDPTAAYPLVKVTFDHPFAFFIKENSTGTILFAGKINKF